MNTKRLGISITCAMAGLFVMSLIFSACGATPPPVTPIPTPTPIPTLSLDETSAKESVIEDFDAVHAPVNGDANQYLIFGNLPVSKPAADLPPELAVFLGRWEGYNYSPPVKKDRKLVLVIQEITAQGGTVFGWSGTNLQYPDVIGEIHFRVVMGETLAIEWQITWPDGTKQVDTFTYDRDKDLLRGWTKFPASNDTSGPYELSRDQSFFVYKDYAGYLANKRIYPREYQNKDLQQYGKGYMLYLPDGYEADPNKTWPLLFFLHGYGDRGDNLFLLPKASPFMMIREKGPLPFVIVAPLLNTNHTFFPDDYMDGALKEILADYRVDQKRIYLTGMSMGGEAAYRFALHQPGTFAAVSPLCAYLNTLNTASMENIQGLPVWAIHGADDLVVPLVKGQQAADALKKAGADVRFSILTGHDHDVWTDTYSDHQFYEWFLQYQKP
jgi:predicted esterase